MSADSDKLQLIQNELAAVLIRHNACAIIVFACDAGEATARVVTPVTIEAPRLDGGKDVGAAFPKTLWERVLARVIREAEKIQSMRKPP